MTEAGVIEQQSDVIRRARDAQRRLDVCVSAVVSARERLTQIEQASLLADEEIQSAVAMAARNPATRGEELDQAAGRAAKLAVAVEATVAVLVTQKVLEALKPLLPQTNNGEDSGVTLRSLSLFTRGEEALSTAIEAACSDNLDTAATAQRLAIAAENLALEAGEAALHERETSMSALEARVSKAQGASGVGPGCLVIIVSSVVIAPIAQLMNAPVLALLPFVVGFVAAKMIKSMRVESAKRARAAEAESRSRLMEFVAARKRAQVQRRAQP